VSTDKLETRVAARPQRRRRERVWRGLTGSLAAGLAGLAVLVLAVGVVSALFGAPGPGPASLIAHPLAAIVALALQRVADRRSGRVAGVAGFAVFVDFVLLLVYFWWWP
jgi:hypothetical protein